MGASCSRRPSSERPWSSLVHLLGSARGQRWRRVVAATEPVSARGDYHNGRATLHGTHSPVDAAAVRLIAWSARRWRISLSLADRAARDLACLSPRAPHAFRSKMHARALE